MDSIMRAAVARRMTPPVRSPGGPRTEPWTTPALLLIVVIESAVAAVPASWLTL
jgi:hypothetical protein